MCSDSGWNNLMCSIIIPYLSKMWLLCCLSGRLQYCGLERRLFLICSGIHFTTDVSLASTWKVHDICLKIVEMFAEREHTIPVSFFHVVLPHRFLFFHRGEESIVLSYRSGVTLENARHFTCVNILSNDAHSVIGAGRLLLVPYRCVMRSSRWHILHYTTLFHWTCV